jgi:hypothetical protein
MTVAAQRRRDAETVARADRQHAQVLAGDDRGVYGEFAPDWPGHAGVPDWNT